MAGKNPSDRFIFYKYVPSKKEKSPLKDEEYTKQTDAAETAVETNVEIFGPPDQTDEGKGFCPDYPVGPGSDECPVLPEFPELPDFPEFPGDSGQCPEMPAPPECPEVPPPPVPEGPCPENSVMHVIQAGDTFWKLAKKYGTTVEAITAANPDLDPLNLQIGESICVPLGIPGAKG